MTRAIQIESLQAGRAIAAMAVLVHHAGQAVSAFASPFPGASILEFGALGVDFFFVLSGFIIYHSSENKRPAEYAVHRLRRVFLPYLPIGVGMAILYTLMPSVSASEREWSWFATLTLFPVEAKTALSVAWTLKHEMLFYAVFAIFFFTRTLLPGLAAWALLIVLAELYQMSGVPLALINLEFIMGIGVALLYRAGFGGPGWLAAAAVAVGAWVLLGYDPHYRVLVGLAVAMGLLPLLKLESAGRVRVPGWLLYLGAASYAIYLAHGVAISIAARLFRGSGWPMMLVGTIVVGALAGIAYHVCVENPLLKLASRGRRAPRPVEDEATAPT